MNQSRPYLAGADSAIAKAVDDLDKVSRLLSRAGGMAVAAGMFELVSLIGDAGCDLDTVINDLDDMTPAVPETQANGEQGDGQ